MEVTGGMFLYDKQTASSLAPSGRNRRRRFPGLSEVSFATIGFKGRQAGVTRITRKLGD